MNASKVQYGFLLLAVIALAGVYDRLGIIDWVGYTPVKVTIQRTGDRPLKAAEVAVMFRPYWEASEGNPERIEMWKPVTLTDGDSFTINVRSGGRSSALGRTISRVQEEVLVLKVNYTDGERQLLVADIPESQSSRELVLRVP